MKKKLIIIFVIGIIALVTVFGLTRDNQSTNISVEDLLAPPVAADYYENTNQIKVDSGSVTIIRNTGEKEVITNNSDVGIDDTIVVGENSEATLYWFDDSISRLSAGTEITINKADYNPENINETDIGFEVVSGEVWSKVQNLVDKDSEFLSYSGSIVAGVRGSTYNHKISDGKVSIASIEHAAFIENDGNPLIIVSGEEATMDDKGGSAEISDIPTEKMNGKWYRENLNKDKSDKKKIMRKKLDRMKKKIGPLPGEPGYDKKQKMLEDKLKSATDPVEKAKIEARIAQIKIQESLLHMVSKKITNNTIEQFELAKNKILESDMPENMKQKMLNELKLQIINAGRILNVGPGENGLYDAKDALRNLRMEWENNPEKRKWLESKITEMRLYEMHDWAKYNSFDPERFERLAERYFLNADKLPDFLKNNPKFKELAEKMMSDLEGKPINLEQLRLLKEKFQLTEREIKVIKEAIIKTENQPIMQPPPPDRIELLNVQPEPTPEIIENAPYHQGESNT